MSGIWSPAGLTPIKRKDLATIGTPFIYNFNVSEGLNLSLFRSYTFILSGVRVTTDNTDLWVRMSGNSGASDYDYAGRTEFSSTDTSVANRSTGAAQIRVSSGSIGSVAANELGVSGIIVLVDGGSALSEPSIYWKLIHRDQSGVVCYNHGFGYRKSTTQITSVDFQAADGLAFEQGIIDIYAQPKPI